jgi:hypothetical protein
MVKAIIFALLATADATAAKAKCSTMFVNNGATPGADQHACETAKEEVAATAECAADPCVAGDKAACCAIPATTTTAAAKDNDSDGAVTVGVAGALALTAAVYC